jgi:hypothetical protein
MELKATPNESPEREPAMMPVPSQQPIKLSPADTEKNQEESRADQE